MSRSMISTLLLVVLVLAGGFLWSQRAQADSASTLSPQQTAEKLQNGSITLVDVREADEYAAEHIQGAIHLPLSQLTAIQLQALPTDRPVVLYCRSGRRSASALQLAQSAGLKEVYHMAGGIMGWKQAGLTHLEP